MSSTSSLRPRRYKAVIACTTCRRRKVKCDGLRPVCGRCQRKRELQRTCTYIAASDHRSSTGNHHHSSAVVSPQLPTPATSAQINSGNLDAISPPSAHSPVNPGEFSFEVRAAVDARLGLPSPKKRCPIPLTDAPLFGLLSIPDSINPIANPADNVLPPRRHADHLVNLYWQCLDPLEPLLDQRSFWTTYEAIFDGREIECNEQIILCILNLIFALSTQLQESTPSEQRNSASRTFFLRAWHLLRPEVILWQAGSLETVQCLILMTQYLRCTSNLHQTWMALGSAVRIALSIGLDRSGREISEPQRENDVTPDVWQQCVFMDRSLSWSLGRSSSAPRVPFSSNSLRNGSNPPNYDSNAVTSVSEKMQELTKITGYINLSEIPTSRNPAEENSLPPFQPHTPIIEPTDRRLFLLRLRIAYTRIILLRPTMAHFCLPHPQPQKPNEPSLADHITQTHATLCVTNAQKLITLIQTCSQQDNPGLIPWWYRVFFLYIAMQHLIAAMLRPDVFATVVVESWNTAVSVLSAHEHLSLSVGRCLNKLRLMWGKVGDIQASMSHVVLADCDMGWRDVFQYLGFEAEMSLFGMDDSVGVGDIDWSL
ncbi:hypothetical protein AFLA_001218 [Aspergillus flavus NRRL3357]|nr:hypothetical protein AFLA_001218 [Aspergillus flavus NRRL3357]